MKKDHFEHKASDYEKDKAVKSNVSTIAKTICKEIAFHKEMHLMDFGSGTGFLLEEIAPFVQKITAVDVSKSMNEQLENKRQTVKCELEMMTLDLTTKKINQKFDGIISSMTLHHIKDIQSIMTTFYSLLNNDGVIAIADLDTEKGNFHTSDTGVFHLGFDREYFKKIAKDVGFKNLKIQQASIINKPHGDFTVFALTGNK